MDFILFSCGMTVSLFALAQVLARNKGEIHYLMALACILLGYLLLYAWAVDTGFARSLPPALVASDLAALFLAAPAFYLTSLTILSGGKRPVRSYKPYFLPAAALAIGILLHSAASSGAYFRESGALPDHFHTPLASFLTLAAYLCLTCVISLDLGAAFRLRKTENASLGGIFRTQVLFLLCYLAEALVVVAACLARDEWLIRAGTAAVGLTAVCFTLTCTTVLYFSDTGIASGLKALSARPEWDRTAGELSARLQDLMERTAPYRDEMLTLSRLARMVNVKPQRLSYHINSKHSMTFRGYINQWRLEAVCQALLEQPQRSILDTAFENGFNSKSSFNTLFLRRYGMTPREYRKARTGS